MDDERTLRLVSTQYDHSRPIGLWAPAFPVVKEKQTFLDAVEPVQSKLDGVSNQPERPQRPLSIPSNIERLPSELQVAIFEQVDIATLVAAASTKSNIRNLVRSMPDVKRIRPDAYAADAIGRMLLAGTAHHFTLKDFIKAFQSSSCALCPASNRPQKESFATDICLLRCCRVCRECVMQFRQIFFIPLCFAERVFDVRIRYDSRSEGMARARVFEKKEQTPRGERNCYQEVEVITLEAAVQLAMAKHGVKPEDLQPLELILNKSLPASTSNEPGHYPIRLAKGVEIMGFSEAVDAAWADKGLECDIAKRSLIASVPYLHPNPFPGTIEMGLTCEGCRRDEWTQKAYWCWDRRLFRQAFLRTQLLDHISRCQTAKDIVAGKYFAIWQENVRMAKMREQVERYWREGDRVPEDISLFLSLRPGDFNFTASQFAEWYKRSMKFIINTAHDTLEERERMREHARRFEAHRLNVIASKALMRPRFGPGAGDMEPSRSMSRGPTNSKDSGDLTDIESKLLDWAVEDGHVDLSAAAAVAQTTAAIQSPQKADADNCTSMSECHPATGDSSSASHPPLTMCPPGNGAREDGSVSNPEHTMKRRRIT
jgi:hypothetical protein